MQGNAAIDHDDTSKDMGVDECELGFKFLDLAQKAHG
jgi:hypothetical protein